MRVGISAYLLHGGADYRSAGVSVYTRQLLSALPRAAPEHRYLAYVGSDAPTIAGVDRIEAPVATQNPLVRIPWEQAALPFRATLDHVDVLHGTVNVIPWLAPVPTVVTVHDLAFMRYPERFPPAKARYLRTAVQLSARRATQIITVSEHTRQDLIEFFRVQEERVTVIHSGVDARFHPGDADAAARVRGEKTGGRRFVLYVGTLEPRKNLDVLIRAFAAAKRTGGSNRALVLVGARGWMDSHLFALVNELDLGEHVVFAGYVPSDELPGWYNAADLFAYPSAYEGFGLPLLEAMACGVPAITTASSALAEVAGDACITVEPGSEEALRVALMQVLSDEGLRSAMRAAGLQRASAFSWEQAARATADVYARAGIAP